MKKALAYQERAKPFSEMNYCEVGVPTSEPQKLS